MSSSTRVGTVVAGYRLEKVLGRGGMSVVYLAEHIRLGRKVALKLLAPALSEDESFRERFVRESRRAAELDHPNIIPIHDAGEDDGQLYIAMRYVEGSDLKGVVKRDGPLQLGRTLFMLDQVASALGAAHERDLVHRDVKPSNVLVSEPSDRVYLTDFGVVKHTASRGLTKTGFFIGTVDYAPPEQIEGLPLDPRTDVYALGCVFYECLTGRAPFDRDGEVAVMHAHLTEPPPKLTTQRPDLPKALNAVIASAMAKDKDERFQTCDDFIDAARAAALQRPTTARRGLETSDVPVPAPLVTLDEADQFVSSAVAQGASNLSPAAVHGIGDLTPAASPPTDPPVLPAAAPPGAPPEPRSSGSNRRRWVVTAALVALAAAGSGVAVYFATKSDSGNKATQTAASGKQQPGQRGLASLIPATLYDNSCQIQAAPLVIGAVQSAVCTPPAVAEPNRFYPDSWEISIFRDSTALHTAYDALRQQNGIGENSGRCDGVSWTGEGAWLHNPEGGIAKPGGRYFCGFQGNAAFLVWSHEKLGQPSHIDTLAVARESGSDHTSLFSWWRFWHHRALGKCQVQGCAAELP